MEGCDFVFHLAANADVRFGLHHPHRDLEQNTLATANVLEAMRANGISRIAFSSTGSIYGEPEVFPTPEQAPFPVQTSLYGASKLACEGLIRPIAKALRSRGLSSVSFPSLASTTHGHVFDFYKQLREHPDRLFVLGDGKQRKSYLHVQDCLDAMLTAVARGKDKVNVFNLGTDSYCRVADSIGWIAGALVCRRGWNIPAASAAGLATVRSSSSIRKRSDRWVGAPVSQ